MINLKQIRIITVLITAILFTNLSYGQIDSTKVQDNEFHTIFGKSGEKTKISGFGALMLDFGNIEHNLGLNIGIDGAVLINQSFYVGIYGRALATTPSYTYEVYSDNNKTFNLTRNAFLGHGGLLVGYIFSPNSPIHVGLSTRFGMGGISLFEDFVHQPYDPNKPYYYENPYIAPLYVFSPQLDLEMNLTKWFKLRLAAGYQFVSNASLEVTTIENGKKVQREVLNTSSYNTPTVSLGFVFGMFD